MTDFFYSLDTGVFYFFNHTISSGFLNRFFSLITNVNNWYIAYIILLAISFIKGGTKGKIAAVGVIILIIFSDQVSHKILKEIFLRERPCAVLGNVITPLGCDGNFSFPSNHAVNNFAAAVFFYRFFPNLKWVLLIAASLVSLSRVYLGLHYPSDILGGAVIGSFFGWVFSLAALKSEEIFGRKMKENKSFMDTDENELIRIRKAEKKDAPLVLSFIKELAEYEKLSSSVTATEELIKKNIFNNKFAEVIIAEYGGQPAGQALYFYNFSTFRGKPGIYLEDLYVKPELRGKGIGKALLLYLVKLATEKDCGRIEWVVLDWNTSAIEFYKNLHAELLDDWRICRITSDKYDNIIKNSSKLFNGKH